MSSQIIAVKNDCKITIDANNVLTSDPMDSVAITEFSDCL